MEAKGRKLAEPWGLWSVLTPGNAGAFPRAMALPPLFSHKHELQESGKLCFLP